MDWISLKLRNLLSKDSIKSKRRHVQYINLRKDSIRMHKDLLGKMTEQALQKTLSKKPNNTQKAFKLISHCCCC